MHLELKLTSGLGSAQKVDIFTGIGNVFRLICSVVS